MEFSAVDLGNGMDQWRHATGPAILVVTLFDSFHHELLQEGWRRVARSALAEGESFVLLAEFVHFGPDRHFILDFLGFLWEKRRNLRYFSIFLRFQFVFGLNLGLFLRFRSSLRLLTFRNSFSYAFLDIYFTFFCYRFGHFKLNFNL